MRVRPLSLALTALLLAGLTGCQGVKFAYNNADWLLMREARGHLCPTDAREKTLKRDIAGLLKWHRAEELPRYADAMEAFADALDEGIPETAVRRFFEALDAAITRIQKKLVPIAVAQLSTLSPEERTCLDKRLALRAKQLEEDLALPDKRFAGKMERERIERLERWFGTITKKQRHTLRQKLPISKAAIRAASEARSRAERAFFAVVVDGKEALKSAMTTWIRDRGHFFAKSDRSEFVEGPDTWTRRTMAVAPLITAAQRAHFQKTLRGYAQDFRDLAKD